MNTPNLDTEATAVAVAPAEEPKATKQGTSSARKPRVAPAKAQSGPKASTAKKRAKKPKAAKQAKTGDGAREGSKAGKVLDLLKRPNGTTLKELMKVTGWQAHSVRGYLSGVVGKKMALTVISTKAEGEQRSYSIKR